MDDISLDLGATLSVVAITGVSSMILATLALGLMIRHAERLVKAGLLVGVVLSLCSGLAALLMGGVGGALLGLMTTGLLLWYACRVWSRIPFAATNLVTASTVVRDNLGMAVYAYLSLVLVWLWAIFWTATAVSVLFVLGDCDADGTCNNETNGFAVFGLLVSYYWTFQVVSNVVTVTVAGVTGTWWMAPIEAASCCSRAVQDSYARAMSYSFGSICLGSLIVAIISATREMVHQMRESGDSMLACVADCLLSCLEGIAEYFNEWAFTFVGIYGMSFMDAGMQVMTLFRSRGWTSIITDDLTGRALMIVSFSVALINGLLGMLIGSVLNMGDGIPLAIPFVYVQQPLNFLSLTLFVQFTLNLTFVAAYTCFFFGQHWIHHGSIPLLHALWCRRKRLQIRDCLVRRSPQRISTESPRAVQPNESYLAASLAG